MEITGKYLIKYFLILFACTYFVYLIPSSWIEQLTAESAYLVLKFFGHIASWSLEDGVTYLVLNGQYYVNVIIIRECTALNVLGIMMGLILPLNADILRKIVGIVFSGVTLFLLNIPRIALTLYLTAYDVPPFTFISNRSIETFHYPISFIFGVLGVAFVTLILSRWIIPELGETLIAIIDFIPNKIFKKVNIVF